MAHEPARDNVPAPGLDQLKPVVDSLRNGLKDKLVAAVLFGSRARGDARPDSDWDILVIAYELPGKAFERHLFLKRALPNEWRGKVTLLAKTPAEFGARLPPLYLDIALDGMILYDRAGYIKERLASLQHLIQEKGLRREQRGHELIWHFETSPATDWQSSWEHAR